ncbi:MAG TPA: glycosyltransferase [Planctomycetota bacterium]
MRILQFNNYADPVGGAEVYALALTRELRQRGHEVVFFGTSPDREASEEHLRVVQRPRYDTARLTRDPSVRQALEETLRRFRPELIHVHNVSAMGIDVLEGLGQSGVPVLQTVHDFSLLCPNSWCVLPDGTACPGGAGAKCFQNECKQNYPYDGEVALHTLLRQRVMAAVVDLAVSPSRYLADMTRAGGVREVRHLHYFIDPIVSGPSTPRAANELVFIGRLEPEKGIEHLLDAMPAILKGHAEARLTIVGGGSLSESLQARARDLGLGTAVTFVSHVPRAELGRFYATSTACVLPSIWSENSPLVAYECLFAGLPMIASRIGGIPELVAEGKAGFTFTPRDPRDLAEKALKLLALPPVERERMSEAMRQRARDFQPTPHLERLEALYAELLRTAPRRSAPVLPVDADLLALLAQYGRERARMASLFHEHVSYIAQLEQGLGQQRSEREQHAQHLAALERRIQDREQELEAERQKKQQEGREPLFRRLRRALSPPARP